MNKDTILEKLQALPEDYWIKRFKKLDKDRQKKIDDLLDEFTYLFSVVKEQLSNYISAYFGKYSVNGEVSYISGSMKLKQSEKIELKNEIESIRNDLDKENLTFDKDIEKDIKRLDRFNITRLEGLKLKIKAKLFYLYSVMGKHTYSHIKDIVNDFHDHTVYEVFKAAGYGTKDIKPLEEDVIVLILSQVWRSTEETFDDTIWRYGRSFIFDINHMVGRGIFTAADVDLILNTANKNFVSKENDIKRLVRTDSTFFSSKGQERAFNDLKIEEAVFTAILDERTTEWCQDANGNVIPVEDITPWENAPPLHYNCRSTMIPIIKSVDWLTGETYEITSDYDDWYTAWYA